MTYELSRTRGHPVKPRRYLQSWLKRGSIYVTLGRMEEKGFVTSSASGDDGRRRYRPTALGERALLAARAFAGKIRLEVKA